MAIPTSIVIPVLNEEKNISKIVNSISYHLKKFKCMLGFRKSKFKNILVMDGDLQHNPKYLPKMIEIFNKKNLDFLVASRNFQSAKNEGLSLMRFYASKIIISIFFIFVGKKTIDPMSGFFIFKKNIYVRNKKKLFGKGYKILSDLIYSANQTLKIYDFHIKFETRKKGKSKMSSKILYQLIIFILIKTLRKIIF